MAMLIRVRRIMRRRVIPFLEIAAAVAVVTMSVMSGERIQNTS
jgi:hypothetical protein